MKNLPSQLTKFIFGIFFTYFLMLGTSYANTTTSSASVNDVAVDSQGNVYYTDTATHRIFKVSSDGSASVVAGTGEIGVSGDGGPATQAQLSSPRDLAIDSQGHMYFVEDRVEYSRFKSVCLRWINESGIVSTLTCHEHGADYFQDMTFDDEDNLYFHQGYWIYKIPSGNIKILPIETNSSEFYDLVDLVRIYNSDGSINHNFAYSVEISGLAVGSDGSVYLSDRDSSNQVFKISPSGELTTVAGNGNGTDSVDGLLASSTGLNQPEGVFLDDSGNLYITEYRGHKVSKVDPQGVISTVAGSGLGSPTNAGDNGLATTAKLYNPKDVVIDAAGNLYIADTGNNSVRKVENGIITTIAGTDTTFGVAAHAVPTYRLYLDHNKRHLLTTSETEYNRLATYGWSQESTSFHIMDSAVTVEDQTSVPLFRIYNPHASVHLWTTSASEYNLLGSSFFGWRQEGIIGYVFESQISHTVPLNRLYNHAIARHHWTIDEAEKAALLSRGWNDEGVIGYVFDEACNGCANSY